MMDMRLDQKVAIVTGAGQGIGSAVAQLFAKSGAKVLIVDANADCAESVAIKIRATGAHAISCPIPVGTQEAAEQIVAAAQSSFGGVDILVNNAAIGGVYNLIEASPEHIEKSIRVNLTGAILLTRCAIGPMMIQKSGKVINMTSRSGFRGKTGETAYAAGKAGIVGFTLSLAAELSEYGINVNAVAPAAWTKLLEDMREPERGATIEKRKNNVLGRVAQPEDVAEVLVYLASDASRYLTGQVVEATGAPMFLL